MNHVPESHSEPALGRPLYIDLDGTLVSTDLLHESVLRLARTEPTALLCLPLWLFRGKAFLKREIARRVEIDVSTLPYREEVLASIRSAKADGSRVVLATASDEKFAQTVAAHLGLFDHVIGSRGDVNLGGAAKLAAIHADAQGMPFVYAGDRSVDLEIWSQATGAIVVSHSRRLIERVASVCTIERTIVPAAPGWRRYLYGVRLHQWLKNILVFLPIAPVAGTVGWPVLLQALVAFVAFGLMASCIYVLNDLLDLEADRRHARKRRRPFASGEISIVRGLAMAAVLFAASLLASLWLLPMKFVGVLMIYLALTSAYSLALKRRAVVDVFSLAGLYTLRIVAGAAATGLPLSFWILSFSLFIFLSLALAKRYVELLGERGQPPVAIRERGYEAGDVPYVLCCGIASAQTSVLLLSLYVNDRVILERYADPKYLWGLVPMLLFWVCRVWFKAARGTLHDDPVVFAARDNVSRAIFVLSACVIWAAT